LEAVKVLCYFGNPGAGVRDVLNWFYWRIFTQIWIAMNWLRIILNGGIFCTRWWTFISHSQVNGCQVLYIHPISWS